MDYINIKISHLALVESIKISLHKHYNPLPSSVLECSETLVKAYIGNTFSFASITRYTCLVSLKFFCTVLVGNIFLDKLGVKT